MGDPVAGNIVCSNSCQYSIQEGVQRLGCHRLLAPEKSCQGLGRRQPGEIVEETAQHDQSQDQKKDQGGMPVKQGGVGALEPVVDCIIQVLAFPELGADVLGGIDAGVDSDSQSEQYAQQAGPGEPVQAAEPLQ